MSEPVSSNHVPELVAAQSLARPLLVGDLAVPAAVLPPGYSLALFERSLQAPARDRGNFGVKTAAAFNTAVKFYRPADGADEIPIFFSGLGTTASIQAVLNPETWRDFTVTLALELSEPFKEWFAKNKSALSQRQFALFLEERTHHVAKPDGAALLELARKFKANVTVRYQSVIEDANGDASLEFVQTTEAGSASAKGKMKVPERITLLLPVWNGGEPVKFDCRFSFDIGQDGKLALSFEILNLNELLADELRKVVARIQTAHPRSHIIEGANASVPPITGGASRFPYGMIVSLIIFRKKSSRYGHRSKSRNSFEKLRAAAEPSAQMRAAP